MSLFPQLRVLHFIVTHLQMAEKKMSVTLSLIHKLNVAFFMSATTVIFI